MVWWLLVAVVVGAALLLGAIATTAPEVGVSARFWVLFAVVVVLVALGLGLLLVALER